VRCFVLENEGTEATEVCKTFFEKNVEAIEKDKGMESTEKVIKKMLLREKQKRFVAQIKEI
jgi:hypothetical protein